MSSHRLTPETLLSLPRPSAALPNPSGTYYVMPYTHFDFGTGRTTRSVALGKIPRSANAAPSETSDLPMSSGKQDGPPVTDILADLRYTDVAWLDDETVVYMRPAGASAGDADVKVAMSDKEFKNHLDKQEDKQPGRELWCKSFDGTSYKIGQVPVDIFDLKTVQASAHRVVMAFSAEVYPENPTLEAVKSLDKKYEDADNGADVKVFDKLFVRHWDTWTSIKKKHVFVVDVEKFAGSATAHEFDEFDIQSLDDTDDGFAEVTKSTPRSSAKDTWRLSGKPTTPLAGFAGVECPVRPFGDQDDFDISPTHLVFVSKDPHLPEAWHTRMHVYLVPLRPKNDDEKRPKCLTAGGGARSFPIFSAAAKSQPGGGALGSAPFGQIAWLEMRIDGYEADRNRLMIYDVASGNKIGVTEHWDRSPASIGWGETEDTILLAAEEEGHKKLWSLQLGSNYSNTASSPRSLTSCGTVSAYKALSTILVKDGGQHVPKSPTSSNILVTMNSFMGPNEAFRVHVGVSSSEKPRHEQISSIASGLVDRLSLDKPEEFWFSGTDARQQVHGFLLRPHGYQQGRKYALAFLVHGGPQSAWTSSWSTRWNANVFAAQGYVVVAINPTGSTGYGQAFTDAINRNWGGSPFKDLVAGLEFVKRTYADMIDTERMVMLGASYGGYMANWIQGHNDVTNFKAIVCHDGIFDTKATWYATEEIYFPEHDLGGTPWQVAAEYEKWNPANHVANWNTPELIIHGGMDFRLPETEGLAVFNALQRRGVPSKLVYFPKENHWVLNPFNSRRWHKEIFDWMKEWVGEGPSQ